MGKRKWIVTIGFIIVIAILSVTVFWQKHQSLQNKLGGNVYQVEAVDPNKDLGVGKSLYYVFKDDGRVYESFSKKEALKADTNLKYFKQKVAAKNKIVDMSYRVTNNHQFEIVYRAKRIDTMLRFINIKAGKSNKLYGKAYLVLMDKSDRKFSDKINHQSAKSATKVKLLLVK